jgi:hypothetical protein
MSSLAVNASLTAALKYFKGSVRVVQNTPKTIMRLDGVAHHFCNFHTEKSFIGGWLPQYFCIQKIPYSRYNKIQLLLGTSPKQTT